MTSQESQENDAVLGQLLRERAELKETIKCLKDRITRATAAFHILLRMLSSDRDYWDEVEILEGEIIISQKNAPYRDADHLIVPKLENIVQCVFEQRKAKKRIAEINETLPD